MNVLLADDDLVDRRYIQHTLRLINNDISVVEVENFDLSIGQLQLAKFDVVLCDYNMQRKSGTDKIDTLKAVGSSNSRIGRPIIMISTKKRLALILLGLEYFKDVNDNYGTGTVKRPKRNH
ncbi:MAG: DNA-binding NarL/FixJ family response regulator [Polaribacter sp.]|jgi:DNA-binding NarL/FixJ family response regulator